MDSEKLERLAILPEQILGNSKSIKTVRVQSPDERDFGILTEMSDGLLDYHELSLIASLKQWGINRLERNKQNNSCRKKIMESYDLNLTSEADKVQEIIGANFKKIQLLRKRKTSGNVTSVE